MDVKRGMVLYGRVELTLFSIFAFEYNLRFWWLVIIDNYECFSFLKLSNGDIILIYRKYANKSSPQIRAATGIIAAFYLVNTDQKYVKSE